MTEQPNPQQPEQAEVEAETVESFGTVDETPADVEVAAVEIAENIAPVNVPADAETQATEAPVEAAAEAADLEEPAAEPQAPAQPQTLAEPETPAEPQAPAEPEAEESPAPVAEPTPVPAGPTPKPRPMPRPPAGGAPAVVAPAPAEAAPADAEPELDPAEFAAAKEFGSVAEDGTVSVKEAAGERVVGQYPDVTADEALTLYVRRYLDLKAQVALFAARLDGLSGRDLDQTLAGLTEQLAEPAVVGDVDGLRAELAGLGERAEARKGALAAEREAARAEALTARTAIVEKAEKLAALDPAKVQWRSQGQELRDLLDEWKAAQRSGVRLDRSSEDSLWKRFSHARSTFDRNRRQHFSELDRVHADVKGAKEALIARAEELSASTEWGPTSAAMRALMDEWKDAGRASRKDDDALWARFRAAQDAFYEARNTKNAEVDAEYGANLEVKLGILAEAEALLPVKDLRSAKAALRDLQERWEAAGRVPRADLASTEARMRAVETAVRGAEDAEWKRTNPRMKARAEGAAAQLEAAIAGLEEDLAKATAAGNQRKIKEAAEALEARKAWLEQVVRAANDAG